MSIYSPHNQLKPSSFSGISDSGNAPGSGSELANLKRESYLRSTKVIDDDTFFVLVQDANAAGLMKQVRVADNENHANGQITSDGVSQTAVNLFGGMSLLAAARADNDDDPNLHLEKNAA